MALTTELVAGAKTADAGVKSAMLKALYEVVSKAGGNMGGPAKASILALIEDDLEEDDGKTCSFFYKSYMWPVILIILGCRSNGGCWCEVTRGSGRFFGS